MRLGIIGSGQIAQFISQTAKKLGYKIVVYILSSETNLIKEAEKVIVTPDYFLPEKINDFVQEIDFAIIGSDNTPYQTIFFLNKFGIKSIVPNWEALKISNNRLEQKQFLQKNNFPTQAFNLINSFQELVTYLKIINKPAILKQISSYYGLRENHWLIENSDINKIFEPELNPNNPWLIEDLLSIKKEFSVSIAKDFLGKTSIFPIAENQYQLGKITKTVVPASITFHLAQEATNLALKIANDKNLNFVGILTVDFFITNSNELLINKFSSQPNHNLLWTSHEYNISQYEQLLRIVTKQPMIEPQLNKSVTVSHLWGKNILEWQNKTSNKQTQIFINTCSEVRPDRHMGFVLQEVEEKVS